MTLVGGLLVVLPLWVSLLLLVKAIKSALVVLHPLAKLLPQTLVHPIEVFMQPVTPYE